MRVGERRVRCTAEVEQAQAGGQAHSRLSGALTLETLRREAERVIDIHSQLEAKVDREAPVMKPAQIQTEKTEDQILLE